MREQAEVNQSQQTEVCSLAGPLFVDITGFVEEQIIYLVLQLNVSVATDRSLNLYQLPLCEGFL